MDSAAVEIAKQEGAATQTSADAATPSATPSETIAGTEFWSATRIAEIADNVSQNLGAEENDLQRTLYIALTGEHFMPVCAYSCLVLARRGLVGVAMMMVAGLANAKAPETIPYTFDVGFVPGVSKLLEVWTVRSGEKMVARYMLVPSASAESMLVRSEATIAVFSVKKRE